MNKHSMHKIAALLLALAMLLSVAAHAEEEDEQPGNIPQRGLMIPVVESEDYALDMAFVYEVANTEALPELPVLNILYHDSEGMQRVMTSYTQAELNDPSMMWAISTEMFAHQHTVYTIALFEKGFYDALIASGKTARDVLPEEEGAFTLLGENGGYVYVGIDKYDRLRARMETSTQQAWAELAIANCQAMVDGLSFQPIEFEAGEFTTIPENPLVFTTQDLQGNAVTNDLFTGKQLTVLCVWNTYSDACLEKLPALAQWGATLPEGVQLVGLISDLFADDEDTLDTALDICQSTGVGAHVNLMANKSFYDLLECLVDVPTVFFIDGSGAFVGSPVLGASVALCEDMVARCLSAR